MPITSRTLTPLAFREDLGPGVKTWRVEAVDARGRPWKKGPFKVTQVEAEIIRDAAVWDLIRRDKAELLKFVQLGTPNTVAAFDYTGSDITEEDGEDHIYLTFAINDREIALDLAWWLNTKNTGELNTIAGRVGFTGDERGRIHQRFPPMIVVNPWLDSVEEAP